MNPIVTSNPKHADVIEASGEVFEYVKQTQALTLQDHYARTLSQPARLCNCIGPQGGEPVCPCQMAHVQILGGRYIMTRDLGPAPVKAAA